MLQNMRIVGEWSLGKKKKLRVRGKKKGGKFINNREKDLKNERSVVCFYIETQ